MQLIAKTNSDTAAPAVERHREERYPPRTKLAVAKLDVSVQVLNISERGVCVKLPFMARVSVEQEINLHHDGRERVATVRWKKDDEEQQSVIVGCDWT